MRNLILENPRKGIKRAYINIIPSISNLSTVILYVTWDNLIRSDNTIMSYKGLLQAINSAKAYYTREYQSKKHNFVKPVWKEDIT